MAAAPGDEMLHGGAGAGLEGDLVDRRAALGAVGQAQLAGLAGAAVDMPPDLDGFAGGANLSPVDIGPLQDVAAAEGREAVVGAVEEQGRDGRLRIAVQGHRQIGGDHGDAGDPSGMFASQAHRHHAAVGNARHIDPFGIGQAMADQIVDQRQQEVDVVGLGGLGVQRADFRAPVVPLAAHALRIDRQHIFAGGEAVEIGVTAHLGGGSLAAMQDQHDGKRPRGGRRHIHFEGPLAAVELHGRGGRLRAEPEGGDQTECGQPECGQPERGCEEKSHAAIGRRCGPKVNISLGE